MSIKNWGTVKLASASHWLAQRFAYYYDTQGLQPLICVNTTDASAATKNTRAGRQRGFLVVAKSMYSERTATYPIKLKSELRKVLLSQHKRGQLFLVGPWQNGQRLVKFAELNTQAMDASSQFDVVVPETWLLEGQLPAGLYRVGAESTYTYFYQPEQGHLHSARQGGVLNSETAIRTALGVSSGVNCTHWQEEAFRALLSHRLLMLPPTTVWQLRVRRQTSTKVDWNVTIIAVAGVFVLYGMLSSAYLSGLQTYRESRLARHGETVNQRLNEQNQLQQLQQRAEQLHEAHGDWHSVTYTWNVLAHFYLQEIGLTRIGSDFNTIVITGEAPSATAVVSELLQVDGVQDVSFTAPVRRGRSGEVFSIEIEIQVPPRSNQASTQLEQADQNSSTRAARNEVIN